MATTLDKLIGKISNNTIIDYFSQSSSTFSNSVEDLSNDYLSVYTEFSELLQLGSITCEHGEELVVLSCRYNGELTARSSKKKQYEIAKKVMKESLMDAAIFIFYDERGIFRFSFVRRNAILDSEGKAQKYTPFRRYTYLVDPGKANKTFKQRLIGLDYSSLDKVQDAFAVEPLNKEFYSKIITSFNSLVGSTEKKKPGAEPMLTLPSDNHNLELKKQFAVRLLGRLIFCWFLMHKKSDAGKALIPESLLRMDASISDYYHSVLEKLFFETLNKDISERDSKLAEHEDIPFLNGGLFDPLTGDVKDYYNPNATAGARSNYGLKIEDDWFRDIFTVLSQYNFTIDENSPYDAEVSIDPEMLGSVFENLLAEIDPDTKKSARKSTSSFYTPRPIVNYMVEQSLVEYLKTKATDVDEERLLLLFKEDEDIKLDDSQTKNILKALSEVKILDPACGSGAFPMGALHKIITALEKLDPNATWWKNKQIENVPNALAKNMLKKKLDGESADYIRKLGVLQNSIYGVDIQPIATEISKLRCFLSLIIDETIIDDEDNRGIQALPNLEFKFVTANTLIGLEDNISVLDFGKTNKLQEQLGTIRSQYIQAYGEEKVKLQKSFKDVQDDIFKLENAGRGKNERALQLASWKPFSNKSNSWFDPYWMYGIEKFDIVIGNPPYSVYQGKSKKDLNALMKNNIYFKAKGGKINAYELFLCKTPLLLKTNGINCQIFQNSFLADNASAGVRRYYLSEQQILTIDSFPERDNPKKRVFENVKMSVCILINKNIYNQDYNFIVNFWNDKSKTTGRKIYYNNKAISEFSDQAIIYNLNKYEKVLFEKYFMDNDTKLSKYYKCLEGELNMTTHKNYLIKDTYSPLVIKGAQVQRYYITDTPSQGEVEYVNKIRYLKDNNRSKKSKHHEMIRIAMQGITGANDKTRLVATIIDRNIFLANSCNYIISTTESTRYSIWFLLGLFNSTFTNWIFRRSSTNSNVNCYEVNSLRLPKFNDVLYQNCERLVKQIISNPEVDTSKEEAEIDRIVYDMYGLTAEEINIIEEKVK
jgi:Alw26I/Eco31I/Esp3I family type II restriction m6 adenine DNA methyltransferase